MPSAIASHAVACSCGNVLIVPCDFAGAMRADDERLRAAAARVGLTYFGCDTADALADEIERLRAALSHRSDSDAR